MVTAEGSYEAIGFMSSNEADWKFVCVAFNSYEASIGLHMVREGIYRSYESHMKAIYNQLLDTVFENYWGLNTNF